MKKETEGVTKKMNVHTDRTIQYQKRLQSIERDVRKCNLRSKGKDGRITYEYKRLQPRTQN